MDVSDADVHDVLARFKALGLGQKGSPLKLSAVKVILHQPLFSNAKHRELSEELMKPTGLETTARLGAESRVLEIKQRGVTFRFVFFKESKLDQHTIYEGIADLTDRQFSEVLSKLTKIYGRPVWSNETLNGPEAGWEPTDWQLIIRKWNKGTVVTMTPQLM